MVDFGKAVPAVESDGRPLDAGHNSEYVAVQDLVCRGPVASRGNGISTNAGSTNRIAANRTAKPQ